MTDIPPQVDLFRQETFGPVAPLVAFQNTDEAIEMANDTPYGLQAAVFTQDISRAFDIAYRLEAGGVIVNWSSAIRVESLPFGGIKMSGRGREGLHDTLDEIPEGRSLDACVSCGSCKAQCAHGINIGDRIDELKTTYV